MDTSMLTATMLNQGLVQFPGTHMLIQSLLALDVVFAILVASILQVVRTLKSTLPLASLRLINTIIPSLILTLAPSVLSSSLTLLPILGLWLMSLSQSLDLVLTKLSTKDIRGRRLTRTSSQSEHRLKRSLASRTICFLLCFLVSWVTLHTSSSHIWSQALLLVPMWGFSVAGSLVLVTPRFVPRLRNLSKVHFKEERKSELMLTMVHWWFGYRLANLFALFLQRRYSNRYTRLATSIHGAFCQTRVLSWIRLGYDTYGGMSASPHGLLTAGKYQLGTPTMLQTYLREVHHLWEADLFVLDSPTKVDLVKADLLPIPVVTISRYSPHSKRHKQVIGIRNGDIIRMREASKANQTILLIPGDLAPKKEAEWGAQVRFLNQLRPGELPWEMTSLKYEPHADMSLTFPTPPIGIKRFTFATATNFEKWMLGPVATTQVEIPDDVVIEWNECARCNCNVAWDDYENHGWDVPEAYEGWCRSCYSDYWNESPITSCAGCMWPRTQNPDADRTYDTERYMTEFERRFLRKPTWDTLRDSYPDSRYSCPCRDVHDFANITDAQFLHYCKSWQQSEPRWTCRMCELPVGTIHRCQYATECMSCPRVTHLVYFGMKGVCDLHSSHYNPAMNVEMKCHVCGQPQDWADYRLGIGCRRCEEEFGEGHCMESRELFKLRKQVSKRYFAGNCPGNTDPIKKATAVKFPEFDEIHEAGENTVRQVWRHGPSRRQAIGLKNRVRTGFKHEIREDSILETTHHTLWPTETNGDKEPWEVYNYFEMYCRTCKCPVPGWRCFCKGRAPGDAVTDMLKSLPRCKDDQWKQPLWYEGKIWYPFHLSYDQLCVIWDARHLFIPCPAAIDWIEQRKTRPMTEVHSYTPHTFGDNGSLADPVCFHKSTDVTIGERMIWSYNDPDHYFDTHANTGNKQTNVYTAPQQHCLDAKQRCTKPEFEQMNQGNVHTLICIWKCAPMVYNGVVDHKSKMALRRCKILVPVAHKQYYWSLNEHIMVSLGSLTRLYGDDRAWFQVHRPYAANILDLFLAKHHKSPLPASLPYFHLDIPDCDCDTTKQDHCFHSTTKATIRPFLVSLDRLTTLKMETVNYVIAATLRNWWDFSAQRLTLSDWNHLLGGAGISLPYSDLSEMYSRTQTTECPQGLGYHVQTLRQLQHPAADVEYKHNEYACMGSLAGAGRSVL
ncbi:hypothetical protein [Sponge holobiont-associated RNA virus]|nr:hypothetical protein [Sponge holobiont-associated RNA virus]